MLRPAGGIMMMPLLRLFNIKKKRTWKDLNAFERRMWSNTFDTKLAELRRRGGHSLENYVVARKYADKSVKIK